MDFSLQQVILLCREKFFIGEKMDIKVGQLLKQDIMISTPEGECEIFRPAIVVEINDVESISGEMNRFYRLHIGDRLLWYADSELDSEKISII
jgi:hypothetical protein